MILVTKVTLTLVYLWQNYGTCTYTDVPFCFIITVCKDEGVSKIKFKFLIYVENPIKLHVVIYLKINLKFNKL